MGYALAVSLILLFLVRAIWPSPAAPAFARMTEQTLIIDPGHGGEDGGAVSVSGSAESAINLSIALQLDQLMGFYGVPTLMTRQTDISIHDSDATTLRQKKVSDLHNRVALINAVENGTLISIHQNSSPGKQHHGTQVFYAEETLSLPLARVVQDTVRTVLDPENTRQPQRIPKTVYLMNHISCRAILVECGFLSNPEEDRLLQEQAYQMKLAMTLASCYLNYGSTQEGESMI